MSNRRLFLLSAAMLAIVSVSTYAQTRSRQPTRGRISTTPTSAVKLIALYRKPVDVARFEQHYRNVHIPLVLKTPRLQAFRVTHYTTTPKGSEPEFYMMAEETYASRADLETARNSPELRTSTKDMEDLIQRVPAVVTLMVGEEEQWF